MKKAVVTFLSILILLSVFCLIAYSAPVFGDVNSDGSITADDARTVLRGKTGDGSLSYLFSLPILSMIPLDTPVKRLSCLMETPFFRHLRIFFACTSGGSS